MPGGPGRRPAPLEQALALRKQLLGERPPSYAESLENLAGLLRDQGDLAGTPGLTRAGVGPAKANCWGSATPATPEV